MTTALDNVAVFPLRVEQEPDGNQHKRERDGLHKRRKYWHTRVKIDGRWKEISLGTKNFQEARKIRQAKIEEFEERQKLPDLASLPFEKAAPLWRGERLKLETRALTKSRNNGSHLLCRSSAIYVL